MSSGFQRTLTLASADDTARLGAALAPALAPGDTILLAGGLGTGKTHFARALIQARLAAAGLVEDVPSPTFTLVQTYFDGVSEIWHCDLFRLSVADEVLELGLDEAFGTAICLIEWPDRLGTAVPRGALTLEFRMTAARGEREVTASSDDPRWRAMLEIAARSPADA